MSFLVISAILLSLVFFGLLRTSIWLIPLIFLDWYLPLAAAAWVSFFFIMAIFSPYKEGAFDLRGQEKSFWILVIFLTGVASGLLLKDVPYWVYAMASLIVFASFQFYKAFRLSVSPIAVFPSMLRLLPIFVYAGLFVLKYLTGHF